ncbi:MAG: D-glycero-beta-D-manno-heptose 1-phosphate adenylyltransferase [Candidatus Omnitrophica bacterium]|nr:D-glycero-beta-D-manno-heptose 1-phosphate adenylyltransferase [Candidatus Omnitrophota bacterium]
MPSAYLTAAARRKIRTRSALIPLVRRAAARGQRIVFTNGCFDLLHPGHVKLFEQAKRAGDVLIVALNSDQSVRRLQKGPGRPVVNQRDRAMVLAGLSSIDYITIFNAPTPQRLISALRPDVLVKGADWAAHAIVGRHTVERHGGRVLRIPLQPGYSTSRLIQRIRARR